MTCPQCGQINQPEARACGRCGALFALASGAAVAEGLEQAATPDPLVGQVIEGRYRLEASLGVGGMGTVYRATRLHIGDQVAVKILHPGQHEGLLRAAERFQREAQTTARLKHPNAVTIYDFGVSPDGLQYLVMELVEGETLGARIKRQGRLASAQALQIGRQVCSALAEAHRNGIIHRDLKPENIIIMRLANGSLGVKVLDFGIAHLREQTVSRLTQTGHMLGTPHYMSPEQCLGEELDERSDIYSLGVVLYETLCGRVPFDAPVSTAVVIKHVNEPPPPMRSMVPDLPPVVEAMVLHALAKLRGDRPQTADAFARELADAERNVAPASASAPHAHQPSGQHLLAATQVLKQSHAGSHARPRRSKTGRLALIAAGCLVLLAASFLLVRSLIQKKSGPSATTTAAPGPSGASSRPSVDYGNLALVRELNVRGAEDYMVARGLYFSPDGQTLLVNKWQQMNADSAGSMIVWDTQNGARHELDGSDGYVVAAEFFADGRTLATAYGYGYGPLKLWDWHTGRLIRNLSPEVNDYDTTVHHIALSPDGRLLAASGGGPYGGDAASQYRVQVWDTRTGDTLRTFTFYSDGRTLAFSPDSRTLACATESEVKLWDTQTWAERPTLSGGSEKVNDLAFTPGGEALATLGDDGVIRLWETKTWKARHILSGHRGKPYSFKFSPDGKTLVSASSISQDGEVVSGEVKLWDVETGETRLTVADNTGLVYAVAPDGATLATASSVERNDEVISAEVKLWDVRTGELRRTLNKASGLRYAANVDFSPDGRTLVTAGWQKASMVNDYERTVLVGEELKLWDIETGRMTREFSDAEAFAFSRDGKMLATGNDSGVVKLWRVQ